MASNVKLQVFRGLLASLQSLATTGSAGVLAWTTDSKEMYVDLGTGNPGIGAGNAWQRLAAGNQVWTGQPSTNLSSFTGALVGDLAITTDNDSTYLLTAYPATTLGNWTAIASTSAVSSVNGQTGVVTLNLDQVPDGVTYARTIAAALTDGEFDLAKSHQFGFTNDNLIQPSQMGTWASASAVVKGHTILDASNNVQQVITAGTTGVTVPTFSAIKTTSTTDGTAVWEMIGTGLRVSVKWLNAAAAHNWVVYIDNDGVQHLAQPSFADISGQLAQTQLPTTIGAGSSLTNIDCGTF